MSNYSNDQSKSDANCFDTVNYSNHVDQNALSKSLNFSRAPMASSSLRDSQAVEQSRIVPQMYMKQLCSGLNTSAVS